MVVEKQLTFVGLSQTNRHCSSQTVIIRHHQS